MPLVRLQGDDVFEEVCTRISDSGDCVLEVRHTYDCDTNRTLESHYNSDRMEVMWLITFYRHNLITVIFDPNAADSGSPWAVVVETDGGGGEPASTTFHLNTGGTEMEF